MSKVVGVLIDVNHGKVEVKTISSLEDYYRILDCSTFDIAARYIGENIYDIYCDDEGLLKCNPILSAVSTDGEPMLVGNLFVTRTNDEGETVSLTIDQIEEVADNIVHLVNQNGQRYPALVCDY